MNTRSSTTETRRFNELSEPELQLLAKKLKVLPLQILNSPRFQNSTFAVRISNGKPHNVSELSGSAETEPEPEASLARTSTPEPTTMGTVELKDWCRQNELPESTADALIRQDFSDVASLKELDSEADLQELGLTLRNKKKLWHAILSLKGSSNLSAGPPSTSSSSLNTEGSLKTSKLPKLEIKPFEGNILEWTKFWQLFDLNVNRRNEMDDATKLSYLITFLKGEAADMVHGLPLNATSYKYAIEMLQKRYGNTDATMRALMDKLKQLSISKYDTEGIKKVFDQWNLVVRSIESVGREVETDYHLTEILCSKLPPQVQTQLEHDKNSDETWRVSTLRDALERIIKERSVTDQRIKTQKPIRQTVSATISTGAASATTTPKKSGKFCNANNNAKKTIRCSFCHEEHYTDCCSKFLTLEERQAALKDRCNLCLSSKHKTSECTASNIICYHCKAVKSHHRALCPNLAASSANRAQPRSLPCTSTQQPTATITAPCSRKNTPMQTARATVEGKDGCKYIAQILLDCGSARSYITEDLARSLSLPTQCTDHLLTSSFGSAELEDRKTDRKRLHLHLKDGSKLELEVNALPLITSPIQRMIISGKQLSDLPAEELADPTLAYEPRTEVDLLLGNDYYGYLLNASAQRYLGNGLFALSTKLGWVLTGDFRTQDAAAVSSAQVKTTETVRTVSALSSAYEHQGSDSATLHTELQKFWQLENIGITDDSEIKDDEIAQQHFDRTVKFEEGRYQVCWPWKNGDSSSAELPENRALAFKRFAHLTRKLDEDCETKAKYAAIINEQLDKEIIEPVSEVPVAHLTHYVPHHPVINPHKTTTKVRIVYDASAKINKTSNSLNECLHRGPTMIADLVGLLLRFRLFLIAFSSDIEKAFLQVGLQMPDRDVTRFFWYKDSNLPYSTENTQVFRFRRVPFGVISSPFLLAATILHHLSKSSVPIASDIRNSIYVDNIISGTNEIEHAYQFYTQTKALFDQASMNLREWVSNSTEFLTCIPPNLHANGDSHSILGLNWNTKSDTLSVGKLKMLPEVKTKRHAVSILSTGFDPLGWFSPVSLHAKTYLQELWKTTTSWDSTLTEDERSKCLEVFRKLTEISETAISRRYNNYDAQATNELVAFSDASPTAYGAVVYLRSVINSTVHVNFLMSKTRLVPVKQPGKNGSTSKTLTLPRAELLGILIATRLIQFIATQLHISISSKTVYSDSQVALAWVSHEKQRETFIANRVSEIRKHEDLTFRYVKTNDNPADFLTHPCTVSELTNLWWKGPTWLLQLNLPDFPVNSSYQQLPDLSAQNESDLIAPIIDNTVIEHCETLDFSRFSSLTRLVRVMAFVLIARDKFRRLCTAGIRLNSTFIQEAVRVLERSVQQQEFHKELALLRQGKQNDRIRSLQLYVDERNLLRSRGRIQHANVPEETAFPKLLPTSHAYSRLVVQYAHEQTIHAGVNQTLAQLRHTYWIPKARSLVKKVLRECRHCRKCQLIPYTTPTIPPLPRQRVDSTHAFQHVGLDYFGPFTSRNHSGEHKFHICIFTCSAIRAIHLELVHSSSANAFLLAIRRFIARRGAPVSIISDNGTQFILANKVLQRVLKQSDEQDSKYTSYFTNKLIQWTFLPTWSPWMGGFYERLIGLVKRSITKATLNHKLTDEQWSTILVEIESTVNSRPLTYIADDDSTTTVLTPNHFLCHNPIIALSDPVTTDYTPIESKQTDLVEAWTRESRLLQSFWNMWSNQYLLALRERKQHNLKGAKNTGYTVKLGDVILFKSGTIRTSWKLARIVELIKSFDDAIRSIRIRFPSGRTSVVPVRSVYMLEAAE